MEDFLNKNGLKPEKVPLILSTSNDFAYSIYVNIDQNTNEQNNKTNLIFCFSLEEAFIYQDLLKNLITDLKYRPFSSSIYLSYESTKNIPRHRTITGIENYINIIDTNKTNYACIIKFNSDENKIITNSMKHISPSWMVNNAYEAYISNDIAQNLPVYYLSQLSGMFYNREEYFSDFSSFEIPSIELCFNTKNTQHEIVSNTLSNFINSFELSNRSENDYHSIIFKIGNKKIYISEYTIIKIIIITIFLSLFFIFILSFINSNLKIEAWKDIRKDWFTIPITLAITIISFFIAKGIYLKFSTGRQDLTAFGLIVFQILLASAFVSLFYWFEVSVRKKDYGERSIDNLILIVTFINQFIFCLSDISLFPLFMVICILSILSIILKKNWFHILLFIFMIIIYLPYIILIYQTTQPQSIRNVISRSNLIIFMISLILLPIYLMLFRVLTAIRKKVFRKRIFALIISSTYIFFLFVIIIPNYTYFNSKPNTTAFAKLIEQENDIDSVLKINNVEQKILGENINTLSIETPVQAEFINVRLLGTTIIPLIYSDEEYTIDNKQNISFKISQYPPKKMTFKYCSNGLPYNIEVQAIYKTKNDNEYYSYTKTIYSGMKEK